MAENPEDRFKKAGKAAQQAGSIASKIFNRDKKENNFLANITGSVNDSSTSTSQLEQANEKFLKENEQDIQGEQEGIKDEEEGLKEQKEGEDQINQEEQQLKQDLQQLDEDLENFRKSLIKAVDPQNDFVYEPDKIINTIQTLAEEAERIENEVDTISIHINEASQSLSALAKGFHGLIKDQEAEENLTQKFEQTMQGVGQRAQKDRDSSEIEEAKQEAQELNQEEQQERQQEEELKQEGQELEGETNELEQEEQQMGETIEELRENVLNTMNFVIGFDSPSKDSLRGMAAMDYQGKGDEIAQAAKQLIQVRNQMQSILDSSQRRLEQAMSNTKDIEELEESDLAEFNEVVQG